MADDGKHHQEFRGRRVEGASTDGELNDRSTKAWSAPIGMIDSGLEDAAVQSRLQYDRMSAEESRLFPEICKGEINRHKTFLIVRNNIVSSSSLLAFPVHFQRSI